MMRPAGFLVRTAVNLHAPPNPGGRFGSIQTYRRRLDDSLVAIFHRACASNNLDAADDLLTVLEKWHAKRLAKYGRERRIYDTEIRAMRVALERLLARRVS